MVLYIGYVSQANFQSLYWISYTICLKLKITLIILNKLRNVINFKGEMEITRYLVRFSFINDIKKN